MGRAQAPPSPPAGAGGRREPAEVRVYRHSARIGSKLSASLQDLPTLRQKGRSFQWNSRSRAAIRTNSVLHASFSGSSSRADCRRPPRSEEHTSELQSRENLVCRLLLEKKKK